MMLKFSKTRSGIKTAKPYSPVWQTGHYGFVSELSTKPIQYTPKYFINKCKL
jgi:hypothetical protein